MDDGKVDLDPDLTSSIGDVLLSSKNDKTDANDSTPTSSTDAASSFSGTSLNVSEDPISSTSSDVMDKDKLPGITPEINKNDPEVPKNLLGTDGDVDLLDMNIADVSSEPINEDVEDIVQDLENLLGEPEPQHDFPRRKEKSPSKERDLIASLDVPAEEKSDSNILPETSNEGSSEKDETDHSIPLEGNIAQITITEESANVLKCSTNENDSEKHETADVTPQEKIECVEEVTTEKTEDISCQSEELQVATPDNSKEVNETEPTQNEATSEITEAIPEEEEISEVNTVSSSEVTVTDKEEIPAESSNSSELVLTSSNDVEEAEVTKAEAEQASDLLEHSEVISEDQNTNIPIETKHQELETTHSNAADSCDVEISTNCDVSEPKAEDEPHSLPTEEVSDEDQTGGAEVSLEEQPLVADLENQVTPSEEQFSVEELQDQSGAPEEQLEAAEPENQDETTITEEVAESMDSSETTPTPNIELEQSSVVEPIPNLSEHKDSENAPSEVPTVSEELTADASNEPSNILESSSTEAVIEPADDGSEVGDVPEETSASVVVTEVEVDRNVSSSSDLSNNEDSDVKETITPDENTFENLEDNIETISEEVKEVIESNESIPEESEEPVLSISECENVEETIPTNEICEGIVEEVESPMPQIPTQDDATEMDAVPSTEESVAITDVTTPEDDSTEDKEIIDEIVSMKEEISEETISSDDSPKSEDNSTKVEDPIAEEKSTTDLEDTPREQSIAEDNTIAVEESLETANISSTNDDKSEHILTLVSPEATSVKDITTQEDDSTKNEGETSNPDSQQDQLENITEDSTSSPLIVNVQEEKCEQEEALTLENVELVDDVPSTNEDIDQIRNEEVIHAENIDFVETETKEDTESSVDKNNSEISEETEHKTVEDITEPTEEDQKIEESPEYIFHIEDEEEEIPPNEAVDPEETIEQSNSPDTEKQNVGDNEVVEEIAVSVDQNNVEELKDNLDQDIEEISCIDTTLPEVAKIETLEKEIIGESEEASLGVEENASQTEVLKTTSEDEEPLELPKEDDSLALKTLEFQIITEESDAATNDETNRAENEENIESVELAQEEKVEDLLTSTQEELVPVNEEVCIKKVIVYEHDCESHKTNADIISPDEEKQEKSDTVSVVEETVAENLDNVASMQIEEPLEEPTEEKSVETDEITSNIDQCTQDSSVPEEEEKADDQQELLVIPQVPVEENIEEIVEKVEENEVLIEQTVEQVEEHSVKEPDVLEENTISNQRQEVTSSSQLDSQVESITSDSAHPEEANMVGQSSSEILVKTSEELPLEKTVEEPQVDSNTEQIIEDQTTAAVQSILNNMLTEERSIEKIIEKEETPVVHSSYSSYEVQKAVQELQGITVEPVEISTEDIECISSSEKTCEPDKIEFENETCVVTNITSQSEVLETQISESKELEETESIEIPAEEIIDEKVECIQEIIDSPPNNPEYQETMTQSSYEQSQDDNGDVQSTEEQIVLPTIEKCSTVTSPIDEPVVVPSIDLSEESSSEDESDHDKKQNVITSSVTSTSVNEESHSDTEDKESKMVAMKHLQKVDKASGVLKNEPKKYSSRETRHSSRISERMKPHKEDINQPLSVNIEEIERDKPYSPKITIKPIKEDESNEEKEEHKGSLKITITKQSDNTHSILKMCSPEVEHRQKQPDNEDQNVVPKLVIKTSDTHSDQHSPKMSTRSSKQVLPNSSIRSGSPRITIKPIIKPDSKETITSPLKITIKPIGKPEEFSRQQQRHSPKQVKNKTDDDHYSTRSKMTKSSENSDVHSPKVTIKPVKPPEDSEVVSTPKITIKPIEKPEEARVSPKITIKPVLRPVELEVEIEDEVKERIVLKINKGNLPMKDAERIGRESRKRELEEDKSEKLAKIKLKFSKDGDAHIVHKKGTETQHNKRQQDFEIEKTKRFKAEVVTTDSDEDVKLIENTQSPIVISEDSQSQDSVILIEEARDPLADVSTPEPVPQVTPVSAPKKRGRPRKVPLVVREEFGNEQRDKISASPVSVSSTIQPTETETSGRPKRSCRAQSVRDTLGIKPRKPSKPRGGKRGAGAKSISMKPEKEPVYSEEKISAIKKSLLTEEALQEARSSGILKVSENFPKKLETRKEEPIKPIGLKSLLEAAKDQNIIEVIEIDTPSNSPKCLEPVEVDKIEEEVVIEVKPVEEISEKEKDIICTEENIIEIKDFEIQKDALDDGDCTKEPSDFGATDAAVSDVEMQPPTPIFAPPLSEASAVDITCTTDIAMFEEETRMSADVSSRAQTPAKQVVSADVVVEESQSSMQSTATTESGKISRRSRLEVHQDQDGSVFTADQLNEYYWGGNGPFMIQEQVAQYLGIKSFKRKYPGIPRRMVDMQERDYIRENGLASESMCDLGLTAVNSADILDIMYTDFQERYEEFCRYQRDKQAKDLLNKQKALSMSANQEKSKLDILEQAVQSAATYNANFNKTRREQRRACMDLQTMNIHYPKGKLKKISMPKIGNYPVAVVPGQFTDYYKEFTPTELNNLPLNTMLYTELHKILPEVSDSDSDSSGSDSDDSSSSGSDSNSSCEDNCKMCDKGSVTPRKSPVNSSV